MPTLSTVCYFPLLTQLKRQVRLKCPQYKGPRRAAIPRALSPLGTFSRRQEHGTSTRTISPIPDDGRSRAHHACQAQKHDSPDKAAKKKSAVLHSLLLQTCFSLIRLCSIAFFPVFFTK